MLTISEVAKKFSISNRQVYELVEQGYISVFQLQRNNNKGISYLFSEQELEKLDIYSILAEVQGTKKYKTNASSFKQMISAVRYYDHFLENIASHPEKDFLEVCFYLFHLNHYAKTYKENSNELYRLKNQVLEKVYTDKPDLFQIIYLAGPDRHRVWLCEDCREAAASARMSYADYIRNEYFCPKCSIQAIDKEYYSLIEFKVRLDEYRFTFHLPLYSASRWLRKLEDYPQYTRKAGRYNDTMYIYGRPVNKVEERIFPLNMIVEKLKQYLLNS
jgi:hypothetical protein